ncbi:RlpA-like double-psi beta-barrel-protein domain-containing protein-containing protein, partial [Phascolomyces articulosus]
VVGKKFKGDGTYYAPGLGSCGEVDTDSDLVVAMNPYWMSNGEMCGKKIKATGPNGSVTVKVVDTCPGCAQNDLDFSEDAYDMIGDKEQGRIPISWKF